MKPLFTLLGVFAALALVLALVYASKPGGPPREETPALVPVEAGYRRPWKEDPLHPGPDPEVLTRLDRLLERMDALETQAAAEETEPRRSLKQQPLPPSRLDDQELEALRALVREALAGRGREVIREEIEAEAWRARQEELAATARLLGKRLALPVECMDPLVAALCASGRHFFELERRLADDDHDVKTAARLSREFRAVRVRLAKDLGRVIEDEILAARIFLYVVSKGDEASLTVAAEDALDLRSDWLR
jgi:hypothetical protein